VSDLLHVDILTKIIDGVVFTPEDIERFWAKVLILGPDECWEWQARRLPRGYGQFTNHQTKFYTHRLAYELKTGSAAEQFVLHTCDNPPCCNPSHLFLGTHLENMKDMREKGRSLVGDRSIPRRFPESRPRGILHGQHVLTEDEVRQIRDMYPASGLPQWRVAELFGIHGSTVGQIYRGENWKHLLTSPG